MSSFDEKKRLSVFCVPVKKSHEGKWQLPTKKLGEGDYGTVYEVCQTNNDCNYVMKVIRLRSPGNSESVAPTQSQFLTEVRLQKEAAGLVEGGVSPPVSDHWICEDSDIGIIGVLIMPSLKTTLEDILEDDTTVKEIEKLTKEERIQGDGIKDEVQEVLRDYFLDDTKHSIIQRKKDYINDAENILQTLNDNNILHGDPSLSNFMTDKTGKLKIIDFGLSRKVNDPWNSIFEKTDKEKFKWHCSLTPYCQYIRDPPPSCRRCKTDREYYRLHDGCKKCPGVEQYWRLKEAPPQVELGSECIGRQVEVFDESKNRWYDGVITDFEPKFHQFEIIFDDDIPVMLDLRKEKYRWSKEVDKKTKKKSLPEDLKTWSVSDFGLFVRKIGGHFEKYGAIFEENRIDGDFVMSGLEEEDLELLIDDKLHRAILWGRILGLRKRFSRS